MFIFVYNIKFEMNDKKLFQQSQKTYDNPGFVETLEEKTPTKPALFHQSNKTYDTPLFAEDHEGKSNMKNPGTFYFIFFIYSRP